MAPTVVLGAGLAGLACAHRLASAGVPVRVLEAAETAGGNSRSVTTEGWTFDIGPHVSFTRDVAVQQALSRTDVPVTERQVRQSNWYRGHWVGHPAHLHLHGLPPDLVHEVLAAAAQRPSAVTAAHYADWCRQAFGVAFAERFSFPYTRKYWTVPPERLDVDWVGPRFHVPTLAEMAAGAAGDTTGPRHYITDVRYPATGGFGSFTRAFPVAVETGRRVVELDPAGEVLLAHGERVPFEHLVSTMPLDDLVRSVPRRRRPAEVGDAAGALLCTSLALVDIAVDGDVGGPEVAWSYVYDDELLATRVSFPGRVSPANVPAGASALQVEVYWSPERPLPLPLSGVAGRVVDEVVGMGLVRREQVRWHRTRTFRHANVVCTRERAAAVAVIGAWLDEIGIQRAGRYGRWEYFWSDDAIRSGWVAADAVARALEPEMAKGA